MLWTYIFPFSFAAALQFQKAWSRKRDGVFCSSTIEDGLTGTTSRLPLQFGTTELGIAARSVSRRSSASCKWKSDFCGPNLVDNWVSQARYRHNFSQPNCLICTSRHSHINHSHTVQRPFVHPVPMLRTCLKERALAHHMFGYERRSATTIRREYHIGRGKISNLKLHSPKRRTVARGLTNRSIYFHSQTYLNS